MREVIRALRPVKRRIRRNRFFRGAAAGLAAGLAAAVIMQAAAFFVPVPDRGLWAAAAVLAAVLLAAPGNAARPVKNGTAAETADACGLKERAITALEPGDGPIRQLQRKDACEALEKLDVKAIRPGSVRKTLLAALICAVLLGALLLIPNAQDMKASARKALNRTLQEGRETVVRAAEEDEARLPDEKKSELRKIAEDLNRELGNSRDAADALVALDRAEQRLEQMRRQAAGDISDVNGAGGDGYGDTEQAGGTYGEAPGSDSAETAGQTGSAEAAGTASGQMKMLQAITVLKSMVNPSLQSGNGEHGSGGQQGTQAGQSSGTGAAGNSGSQSGQNVQGAGGSSAGSRAGSGAGEGSTNEEQQGGGGSSNGPVKGNRDPRYKETEYETIYDPEHISKQQQDVMTEQYRLGDEESLQIETGPGKGSTSGDVPWGEVLQEYAETEARAADRENLTTQEREWVNEYYRLLTEQQ